MNSPNDHQFDEYEYDDDFFEDGSEDEDAGQFGPPAKYLNQMLCLITR